jgi:hypothetical protein
MTTKPKTREAAAKEPLTATASRARIGRIMIRSIRERIKELEAAPLPLSEAASQELYGLRLLLERARRLSLAPVLAKSP